ncbi:hypothetical protein THOM_0332 [Trachipleistophora hominis]|uniref:Uncharacterized protein n=1 Tax=Trachipleistophora hominis TaxID=72359 RepID=L7JZZ4_TRAHO|nr:hypothetical protein THOM_0332 [Trachipleistophora hominis]
MVLCIFYFICGAMNHRLNYMPHTYTSDDNGDNNGIYSYSYHDRRNPEDNSLYKYKNKTDDMMNFDQRLYHNIEQVLRKRSLYNTYHNNGIIDYNNSVKEKVNRGNATPGEYDNFKQMEKEEIRTMNENQPIAGETNNVNKEKKKFNVLKWLENYDDEMEEDSEAELQKILEDERKKQEEEAKEQKKKLETKERENAKEKENRRIRFLQWVKRKLKIE